MYVCDLISSLRITLVLYLKLILQSNWPLKFYKMGRGVSSGGGQSSLGYLFGGGEAPKSAEKPAPVQKPAPSSSAEKLKEIPAGIQSSKANNYMRAEGQNCGNFLTVSVHFPL